MVSLLLRGNGSTGGRMKKFFVGFLIGAIIAFHLGINFGRHKSLLSNPYESDVVERVKESAGEAVDTTREAIHEATEPARENAERKLSR
jgi:gas vesicle protein